MESKFRQSVVAAFATVAINDVEPSQIEMSITSPVFKAYASTHSVADWRRSEEGRRLPSDMILAAAKDLYTVQLRHSQPYQISGDIDLLARLVYRPLGIPLSADANKLLASVKADIDLHQTHTLAAVHVFVPTKSTRYQMHEWAMRMDTPCFTFVDNEEACRNYRLGVVLRHRIPPNATIRYLFYRAICTVLAREENEKDTSLDWLRDAFESLKDKPEYGRMHNVGYYKLFSNKEVE
jgi:hypothetical protein